VTSRSGGGLFPFTNATAHQVRCGDANVALGGDHPSCWPFRGATVTRRSNGRSYTSNNSVTSRKPSRWANVRDLGIS
jgi:hypothetical protein